MRALVTGATGFTGGYVVARIEGQCRHLRCFVRCSSDLSVLSAHDVELVYGDLGDICSLRRALAGMDTLVNIASLGFGHAPNIVDAARNVGIERAVFISTTGIFTTLDAKSKAVRLEAERLIRESDLAYTILRPTMIYGSRRDRNMARLINYIRRYPVIPIFGSGEYLQQPVYVGDVADAVASALYSPKAISKAYNIAGANPLTYNEVIETVCRALGRHVWRVHIPVGPAAWLVGLQERLLPQPILKVEQILRLNEHKAFSYEEAVQDLDYHPLSFEEGLRLELQEMGLA